ncbi:mediator of RNA polymerase II transcription subunit 14 [Dorcoceras hygrometricum]|uniref:Mediator of RNA polymerase II transcription subunit 14 n=1 Tax=Dorcoceras hygrometricum TaxID=472368 RepID=A0A2Z7DD52_9LAMI|nr:mediator of RNA polymerase II transcription subunit 14 [Dorcoceras hygrometricum]
MHEEGDNSSTESATEYVAAPPAGLKPRPAVKPGFPENNTTRKTTKPQRDMGSNPSTESNYKTAVNSKIQHITQKYAARNHIAKHMQHTTLFLDSSVIKEIEIIPA